MTPAEKMGLKVGDRVRINGRAEFVHTFRDGDIVLLYKDDGSVCPSFTNGAKCQWVHLSQVEPIQEVQQLTHLPDRFKLNPAGNEALSKAMQKRLFALGYRWISSGNHLVGEEAKYVFYAGTYQPYQLTAGGKLDTPTVTLDDLYRLTPAPQELPKLEIAGRTLELKDGRVVGKEFNCNLALFRKDLEDALRTKPAFGDKNTQIAELHIGCQTVTRDDLQRALAWATEVSK